MKIALGILIGISIVFSLFWGYRKVINPYYTLTVPKFITDTTKKSFSQEEINNLKSQSLSVEEKLSSANKRMDDILIFGGIIITLLLAINIGVYVNAEKEVNKHLKENFEAHKNKILQYSAEVEETVGKAKTELELLQNFKKQAQSIQIPSP